MTDPSTTDDRTDDATSEPNDEASAAIDERAEDGTDDRTADVACERTDGGTDGPTDVRSGDATDDPRTHVREAYGVVATSAGEVAAGADDRCGSSTDGCCGESATDERARSVGYETDDLAAAPEGANLGLGCGNPVAISELEPGETVLDLGSGGGFDCFLAVREVGPDGRVIGVDMTPEMLERARENARESEFENVEFRLGEIEHLPVADATVDAVISNCVLNLSPAKPRVLRETFRVLRPGGRVSISDLVAIEPLPPEVREDPDLVDACVGGAATTEDLETWLAEAGFVDVSITVEDDWSDEYPIVSARIEARKPA